MPSAQGLENEYESFRKLASKLRSNFDRRPARDEQKKGDSVKAKKSDWSSSGYIKLDEKGPELNKSRTLRKLGEIVYAMSEFPVLP
jgi:hypothetical protein